VADIRVDCPNCSQSLRLDDQFIGRKVRCQRCGHTFKVEAPATVRVGTGPGDADPSSGSGDPAPNASAPGELSGTFGRYEILGKLGQGGMGAIYLARDTELRRQVALKVIKPGKEFDDAVQRLRREAQAAAGFDHPNICPVYEVGEVDGTHY
jgi:predicted Zn finger-like uncharacterized protein